MTSDLSGTNRNSDAGKALADVESPLRSYLSALVDLLNGAPDEKGTFTLVAQRRQKTLTDAVDAARQRYEIPLPDPDVIKYGIVVLSKVYAVQGEVPEQTSTGQGKQFARSLKTTLEAIIGEARVTTLTGLTTFARNYSPL